MPRKYPPEFVADMVAFARRSDMTQADAARDFGLSKTTVQRWVTQADIDDGVKDGLTTAEQSEMVELRRANRRLEQENEILRRATAYFA